MSRTSYSDQNLCIQFEDGKWKGDEQFLLFSYTRNCFLA